VDSIKPIGFPDITPELARESGFLEVIDLLKLAKQRYKQEHLSGWVPLRAVAYQAPRSVQARVTKADLTAGRQRGLCGIARWPDAEGWTDSRATGTSTYRGLFVKTPTF
jgi:hypothetical protein